MNGGADTFISGKDGNPERSPDKYAQLTLDKSAKWKKDSLFNRWCRSNWIAIGKNVNLNLNLRP
jgi:hypothetical protein